MLLESLGDFNDIINSGIFFLEEIEKLKPNNVQQLKILNKKNSINIFILRSIINSIALIISQCYERANVEEEEVYKKVFDKFDFINRIVKENNISYKEAVKQIRNCFCHGEYWVKIYEDRVIQAQEEQILIKSDGIVIYLNNDRKNKKNNDVIINGEMTIEQLWELEYAFSDLKRLYCEFKETWIMSTDKKYLKCKNRAMLDSYIKNIKRTKIIADDGNGKGIEETAKELCEIHNIDFNEMKAKLSNYGLSSFVIENYPLTEDEENFIKTYIEYIGFEQWHNLYVDNNRFKEYARQMISENVFQCTFDHILPEGMLTSFFSICGINYFESMNNPLIYYDIYALSFQGPILYANLLLGLANYEFVYAKEVNKNEELKGFPIFNFKDIIDMQQYIPIINDKENPALRYVDPKIKNDNIIDSYNIQIQKKNKKIKKLKKILSKSTNLELNQKLQSEILVIQNDINNLNAEISRQQSEFQFADKSCYVDCTNFFRYLRNSIVHGTYSINYNEALKSKRMKKIKFEFCDYAENDKDKKYPLFKIILTAEQLLKLLEKLQKSINNQVENNSDSRLTHRNTLERLTAITFDFSNGDVDVEL